MKMTVMVLAVVSFALAVDAQSISPAKRSLIEELMRLTEEPASSIDYRLFVDVLRHSNDPKDRADADLNAQLLRDITMKAYGRMSENELRQTIAFFNTEPGKHYLNTTVTMNHERVSRLERAREPNLTAEEANRRR